MTPSKLSEADKQDIITRYRLPDETTTTLANRYDVSTTTISRILKNALLESEYEALVQQKRSTRSQSSGEPIAPAAPLPEAAAMETVVESGSIAAIAPETAPLPGESPAQRRQRKRPSAASKPEAEPAETTKIETQLPLDLAPAAISPIEITPNESVTVAEDFGQAEVSQAEVSQAENFLVRKAPSPTFTPPVLRNTVLEQDEDLLDQDDDEFDDLDDDEDLDDDDDEDDDDELEPVYPRRVQSRALVEVLPFAEAAIPRTFYLVVDRAAELITRPLRDFGELGQIPDAENQEKTLPIFDNHRVAKRFSKKNQRIIKVPDGRMLQKVGNYLQAKGITRLLIDGQVYSL